MSGFLTRYTACDRAFTTRHHTSTSAGFKPMDGEKNTLAASFLPMSREIVVTELGGTGPGLMATTTHRTNVEAVVLTFVTLRIVAYGGSLFNSTGSLSGSKEKVDTSFCTSGDVCVAS